uniref:Zgc:112496 n=1 Tax=Oncorhynchus kisutch TaxID=8019 RepID=A0A8C7LHJ6_ONCKI
MENCYRKAFSFLPDIQAAITELGSLKALGPDTASAVLAPGAPEQAAFMANKAVESVPGLRPFQYTARHYALYLNKMASHTQINQSIRLKHLMNSDQEWTPHRVELCLWPWAVANQLQLPLMKDVNLESSLSNKTDPETNDRPAKRQRTK